MEDSCDSDTGLDACTAEDVSPILDSNTGASGVFEALLVTGAAGAATTAAVGAEPPSALSAVLDLPPEILEGEAATSIDGGLGR